MYTGLYTAFKWRFMVTKNAWYVYLKRCAHQHLTYYTTLLEISVPSFCNLWPLL